MKQKVVVWCLFSPLLFGVVNKGIWWRAQLKCSPVNFSQQNNGAPHQVNYGTWAGRGVEEIAARICIPIRKSECALGLSGVIKRGRKRHRAYRLSGRFSMHM